jgi:hypothetical protein
MTPPGESLTVFEPGLAVTHLFAHHFHVHMPREAPINVPQPRGRLKIPCHSALFTAKRPVRTALVGFSAHISVLHA